MDKFTHKKSHFQYYMGDLKYILAWRDRITGQIFDTCPQVTKKIWLFEFKIKNKDNYEQCLCKGTDSYSEYSSSSKGWGNISGYGPEPLGCNIKYNLHTYKHIYEADMLRMPNHYLWSNNYYIENGRLMSAQGRKGRVYSNPLLNKIPEHIEVSSKFITTMRTLISPTAHEAREAPSYIRHIAEREKKEILKITHYTPRGECAQWSIRPYRQRQRADDTVAVNIHYIALQLCQELNINYKEVLKQAYPSVNPIWIDNIPEFVPEETIVPTLSEESLKNLLIDLTAIDNQEITEILEKEFTQKGYNITEWWSQN